MEIITAKNAGFCFGVEKAVDMVYDQLSSGDAICTYGEIIHNEAVVEDLAKKGVRVVDSLEELHDVDGGCVVVCSHGVGRDVYDAIEKKGLRLVDATCPFVTRIHDIVRKAGEEGRAVVVAGSEKHPEVQGIMGWASGPVFAVETPNAAEELFLPKETPITIVSQTTFNLSKFKEIVEIFKQKGYNIHIANTICNATSVRQEEAEKIASAVDVMVVVGGAHSSNTRKLYEICKGKCAATYLVQNAGDLKAGYFSGANRVGITAGASTPKKIIEEVQTYVRTGSDV